MDASPVSLLDAAALLLGEGKSITFKALGRSMWPFIREGSEIIIQPLQPDVRLRRGDIIFYRAEPGRPVLHRLISRDWKILRTRGDAFCEPVEKVPREKVLGVLAAVNGKCFGSCQRLFGLTWAAGQSCRRLMRRVARKVLSSSKRQGEPVLPLG